MEAQRQGKRAEGNLVVAGTESLPEAFSFLLIGDPGEGDASQYAVVPPLRTQYEGTNFLFVLSDVIYPAGDVNQYVEKFYYPYRDYPGPIYAIPGNHDWYDGLNGFMQHFCEAEPLAPETAPVRGMRERLRRWLWREASETDPVALAAGHALRVRPEQQASQPGPYFLIEAPRLRIVAIDPGIGGVLDAEQGDWLERVSFADPEKPKLLLTGKPLLVNGKWEPCQIDEGSRTVKDIVAAPEANYVAAIGGDIHNYQRYCVERSDGAVVPYIVSGGGGAYTSATHRLDPIPAEQGGEDRFRCYPLRGDSLSFYSHLISKRLRRPQLSIPADQASLLLAERAGLTARPAAAGGKIKQRSRDAMRYMQHLPGGRLTQRFFSEIFDYNEPPMFKHFLRLDVSEEQLRIRCFAATGCADHEGEPPVEDDLLISLV